MLWTIKLSTAWLTSVFATSCTFIDDGKRGYKRLNSQRTPSYIRTN